jgi:hypothetical protein
MLYFVGLDLGPAQEFTAPAVLERPRVHPTDPPARRRPPYALRHLRRFPLGTPYPAVVRAVRQLLNTPPLPGAMVAVDQTGVGRAVVNLLADGLRDQARCLFCPITLTADREDNLGQGSSMHVPKQEFVGTLQVLLQTRRLEVARALPDAPLLVKELENFRVKVPARPAEGPESWRDGPHDDLVLAVALAAWVGEQALPPPEVGPGPGLW